MSMKARHIMIAAAFAALAILSSGCKKGTFGFRGRPGDEIRFAIRSGATASETKTVYNDNNGQYFFVDNTKYVGIDWVAGDRMTVAYIFADPNLGVELADYYIADGEIEASTVTDGKVVSKGTLKSVETNGLQWHDGDVHQFYASYPAIDDNYPDHDSFVFKVENGAIHADVPYFYPMTLSSKNDMTNNGRVWTENMKYAYMNTMNGEPSATGKGGAVTMTVGAHFTAFEIDVRAKGTDVIPLKSFTLSCSRPDEDDEGDDLIGGTFFLTAKYNENHELWWDNVPLDGEGKTSNAITLDFSGETEYKDGGVVLTKDAPVKFTVFVRGGWWLSHLTVGFDIIKDGVRVNRSLKLAYVDSDPLDEYIPWISFSSNCKHRIYGLEVPLVLDGSLWFDANNAGGYTNEDWND